MSDATKLGSLVVSDLLAGEKAIVAAISSVSQALHTASSCALQLDDPRANGHKAYARFVHVLATLTDAHGELSIKAHRELDTIRDRLGISPEAIGVPEGKDSVLLPRGASVEETVIVA